MKSLIKKLVREKLSEDFETTHNTKWDAITNTTDAYDITSTYDSHELIDFITHYDSHEYFSYKLDELIRGVNDNQHLEKKPFKKLYLELLLKEKSGSLSSEEREQLSNHINKNNNDYPISRKDIYR